MIASRHGSTKLQLTELQGHTTAQATFQQVAWSSQTFTVTETIETADPACTYSDVDIQ